MNDNTDITIQEIQQLLGARDLTIHLLEKQIIELQKQLKDKE